MVRRVQIIEDPRMEKLQHHQRMIQILFDFLGLHVIIKIEGWTMVNHYRKLFIFLFGFPALRLFDNAIMKKILQVV